MNRSKAIKVKCLVCSGNNPKEVTLCHLVDCPLWPYRFGYSMKDRRYRKRMELAKKRWPKDYQEMQELAEDVPFLPKDEQIGTIQQKTAPDEGVTMPAGTMA